MVRNIPPERIASYIKSHFKYKVRKNNEEYVICNPLNGDTGFHFNINVKKGVCHDWRGDEWAGPLNPKTLTRNCSFLKFVSLYKNLSYFSALREILGTHVDIRSMIYNDDQTEIKKISIELPKGATLLSTAVDEQSKILVKWLKSRGYTNDSIKINKLQYLGMEVFWPYYEFESLVYWQSRSRINKKFNFPIEDIKDQNGKTIGKTEGSKKDYLYGFDQVEPASYIIITEAIFDQNTLGEQALATGGAVLTTNQIKKLKVLGPKEGIILSPDNDSAGLKSIISNAGLLTPYGFKVYYSVPPKIKYEKDGKIYETKDWNELGQYVIGFDKVRSLHDDRIRMLDEKEIFNLEMAI